MNRTTFTPFVTSELLEDQNQCFRLDVAVVGHVKQLLNISATLTFLSDQRLISQKKRAYPFYGIAFPDESFFMLAGTFVPDSVVDANAVTSFLSRHVLNGSTYQEYFMNQEQITNFLTKYPNKLHVFRIVTIAFGFQNVVDKHKRRFDLDNVTYGKSFESQTIHMELRGIEINGSLYSQELRISTVVLGFMLTLALYSWRSLLSYVSSSNRHLQAVSSTTLLMEIIYQIAFGVVMTTVSDTNVETSTLMVYFFFAQLVVYGAFEFPVMEIVLLRRTSRYTTSLNILVKVILCLFSVLAPFLRLFRSNNFFGFLAAFVWVPQIWKNIQLFQKDGICLRFVVFSTISRVIFSLYLTRYRMNIIESNYLVSDDIVSVVLIAQAVFLVLQSRYGPHLFIPTFLKPRPFDYRETIPPDNEVCPICFSPIEPDDSAVTPCHHAFHMSCLVRCMEEKDECPLCRERLPPMQD